MYFMPKPEINVLIEGNCHYSLISKKLSIYNGTVTDEIINLKIVGNYLISVDKTGEIFVTVPPTYVKNKI